MSPRSGCDVLLEVLADEGVEHIFGNPGTTELPLMDGLTGRTGFQYVLGLQENVVVGMADGYAQATGRPAFVNLHTAAGLGGGLGNLTNAVANRTPLVVTAGQQDRRHLLAEPMLSGDLVGLARTTSKWQHEVRDACELGPVLRRAFKDSRSAPSGPVFVSVPMDVLADAGEFEVPGRSHVRQETVAPGLEECADLLVSSAPDEVALVVGEEVAASGSFEHIVAVAEALGCPVYGAPFYSALPFPTDHPLWKGMLGATAALCRETLSAYRRVFFVGGQVGFVLFYSPGPAIPAEVEVLHLSPDASAVGRTYSTRLGMVGDVSASLAVLRSLVTERADHRAAAQAIDEHRRRMSCQQEQVDTKARGRYDAVPIHPMAAAHGLLQGFPASGVVIDEAVSTGWYLRNLHRTSAPKTYYFSRGGGLGWGMPTAVGVKLACPDRPVMAVVGDGAAMYSFQSLWTAAHLGLGVLFVVLNNRRYRVLRDQLVASGGRAAAAGRFVAMDLEEPAIDYVRLARSLGVDGIRIEKAVEVADAVRFALASERPALLELRIDGRTNQGGR